MSYTAMAKAIIERQDRERLESLEGPISASPEGWTFRRTLVPNQSDPAEADVWMLGTRNDGLLRWWFAETIRRESK